MFRGIHIAAQKDGNPLFAQLVTGTFLSLQVECPRRQHLLEKPSFIQIIDSGGLIFLLDIYVTFPHPGWCCFSVDTQ